jgi:hypothetical protein
MKKDRCGWTDPLFRQCTKDVDHEGLCDFEPAKKKRKSK